jgi:hypothetical protein
MGLRVLEHSGLSKRYLTLLTLQLAPWVSRDEA